MAALRIIPFVVLSVVAATAGAQTPSVSRTTPFAIAPGKTVDLSLYGNGLQGPTAFWSSFPGLTAQFTEGNSDRATSRVTLPPEAQVGIGAFRVATRGGVSNLYLFMVDDLPSVAERGGNTTAAAAQELVPPVAVDGTSQSLGSDYYRFEAKRGQRVSVEVVATRLGSALDPVLRLLDAAGRELACADHTPGAAGDCRFAHTFDADGQYLVELRDVGYEGGDAYRYRLRVGDFPLAVVPFPLGGRRGSAGMFSFLGEGCADVPPAVVVLPAHGARFMLGARRAPAGGSGFVGVVLGEVEETVEAEPNDSPDAATPLNLPAAVNGRFEAPGDVDFYKLAARKGDRFTFRSRTRGAGSSCDLLLTWTRDGRQKLAASKVDGGDASLDVTAPDDGTYWLRVEEISRAGGPALAYRIEADRFRPGFSLSVETDKVDAKPGGEFELKVTCTRREYAGPIALSVDGVTPARLDGATIPAGKQEAQLKVKLPQDLPSGSIVHFKVAGAAADFRTTASTAPALRKLFPRLLDPPDELDGTIALGVRGEGR